VKNLVARADNPGIAGIKEVSHRHEALLNFILANPMVRMQDVAAAFGYSAAWCSLVIHSDAFQKLLREKQEMFFDVSIMPAMDKVSTAADMALDKIIELIPRETDIGKLNSVADKALNRLGYSSGVEGNGGGTNVQVNVTLAQDLARARDLIGRVEVRNALPGHAASAVGEVDLRASLPAGDSLDSQAEGRDQVREENSGETA